MSALTDDRNTPMRDGQVLSVPAAGGKMFYAGAMIAINRDGFATPGDNATGSRGAGRCESNVDNTAGADGDLIVAIRKGIFRYDNDPNRCVKRANIGYDCFIVDDQTASISKGEEAGESRPIAGKVFDVDSDGVWVRFN